MYSAQFSHGFPPIQHIRKMMFLLSIASSGFRVKSRGCFLFAQSRHTCKLHRLALQGSFNFLAKIEPKSTLAWKMMIQNSAINPAIFVAATKNRRGRIQPKIVVTMFHNVSPFLHLDLVVTKVPFYPNISNTYIQILYLTSNPVIITSLDQKNL